MSSGYASSWRSPSVVSDNGPRAKCDQVVFEAIAKAAEIVVGSRCQLDGAAPSLPSSSTRFNLHVPEVQGVRAILQKWRRALHVPLRLDVYYQHPPQQNGAAGARELLERWCLEYSPSTLHDFLQEEGSASADPLVQLRYVCKKIVIWLRTLYCWSRLLPSQVFRSTKNIGFSIAVVEGTDDMVSLATNQGFLFQHQPSCVRTPYGELAWKVYYAPKEMVERLLPVSYPGRSESRPIPTNDGYSHVPRSREMLSDAKSAPSRPELRPYPETETAPSATYQGSRSPLFQRSNSLVSPEPSHPRHLIQRSNSTTGQEIDSGDKTPERVLSGLSLALMNDEPKDHSPVLDPTMEKQRAAFHNAPPHVVEQQQQQQHSTSPALHRTHHPAGEYGYAYNSHIPWQQIRPSTTTPTVKVSTSVEKRSASPLLSGRRSDSPSPLLVGTPPSGAFLGAGTTPPISSATLIPPRTTVTPPFTRPLGFIQDASRQQMPQSAQAHQSTVDLPPMTSLDLLHSRSPFQQPPGGSLLSSLSVGGPASGLGGASFVMHSHISKPSDLRHSLWNSSGPSFDPAHEDDEDHEMPFAVDPTPAELGNHSALESSTVAMFAEKCSIAAPLKLFESRNGSSDGHVHQPSHNDMVASVADQLAEFHAFEASLDPTSGGSDNDQGKSTSTPISLRMG